jgi:hypothetical protein
MKREAPPQARRLGTQVMLRAWLYRVRCVAHEEGSAPSPKTVGATRLS